MKKKKKKKKKINILKLQIEGTLFRKFQGGKNDLC